MYYVYQILDKKGNLLYIGKGKDEGKYSRLQYYKYLSQDRYIDRKLKKIKKFDIEILKEFVQEKDALVYEQFLIEKRNPLCNLTTGGEGVSGYKHTSVSKEKMSKNRDIDVSLAIDICNVLKKNIDRIVPKVSSSMCAYSDHIDVRVELKSDSKVYMDFKLNLK